MSALGQKRTFLTPIYAIATSLRLNYTDHFTDYWRRLIGDTSMLLVAKIITSVFVFLAAYFFFFWVVYAQIFTTSEPFVPNVAAFLTAVAAAVWVWWKMGAADRSVVTTAACWAAVAGALGFCGGFFGPLIFTPEAIRARC